MKKNKQNYTNNILKEPNVSFCIKGKNRYLIGFKNFDNQSKFDSDCHNLSNKYKISAIYVHDFKKKDNFPIGIGYNKILKALFKEQNN